VLFDDSVELLDEFKQFLPEPKNQKKRSSYIPNLGIAKVNHVIYCDFNTN
jgi:paired amphipathic helix protein Sin3a